MSAMQTNRYLFVWDCLGLETIVNLTELEQDQMIRMLKADADMSNTGNEINILLNNILLRAKFNPQRFYEIYACDVDKNIGRDNLTDMFKNNPQTAADLIRERGHKIYSDRLDKTKVAIV